MMAIKTEVIAFIKPAVTITGILDAKSSTCLIGERLIFRSRRNICKLAGKVRF